VDKATSVLNGVKTAISATAAAGEKMKAWGQQASVGGALMKGASDQIIGALDNIVAPANAVEDSIAKVATVITPMSGTVVDALARTEQAALAWSKTHNDAASKFIDTTYMMISAGLNEKAAVEATRTAMLVAKATMGESTEAANLIGGAYNTMGDKSKDAAIELTRLGDVVTKTQQLFQFANFAQLSEGLKNSVAGALQTGLSFEQLNTVIGTLNSNQLQGANAGTAMKAAMLNMNRASKDLKFEIAKTATGGLDFIGTLGNIEKKFGALQSMSPKLQEAFRTAFGDEGNAAISLLLGKSKALTESLAKVQDSAGAAATAAGVMNSTTSAQSAMLSNQWLALKVILAGQLRPTLEAIGGYATRAIAAFSGFAATHPTFVRTAGVIAMIVAALTGIVGPILLALGSLSMFGGHVVSGAAMVARFGTALFGLVPGFIAATGSALSFAAALLANPITWIVLAIVALAALIYVYWDPIKAFFIAMWDTIKAAFVGAWQYCVSAWNGAMAWFSGLWSNITSAFDGGIMGVLGLFAKFSPLGLIVQALNAVTEWLFGFSLIDAGANILRTLTQGIRNAASGPIDAMMSVVQKVRNLLPFSPAKAGPLRDLHRVRLIETLADTVRPMPLVAAMSGAAAAAMAAVPDAAMQSPGMSLRMANVPTVAALPDPGRRGPGDGSEGGDGGTVVHFHIAGNADSSTVAQLESWARSNSKLLYTVVKREGERDKRSDFG
jgi:TP901 family phage tail tape measure protein